MKISLHGEWALRGEGVEEVIDAQVPGDNYTALEKAGLLPDPYYRLNEWEVQWPVERDWVYERTFTVDAKTLAAEAILLEFESIDTVADVVLNGEVVGHVANEFRRWRFEVQEYLREGENRLEVRIRSVQKAIEEDICRHPHPDVISWGCNTLHQIERLRKAQCSSGWDWGISLPVSGIYGEVNLFTAKTGILAYLWEEQSVVDGKGLVRLVAEVEPTKAAKAGDLVSVCFRFEGEEKVGKGVVPRDCGTFQVVADFVIEKPELWWPNGFGGQKLYKASATLGEVIIERKIGFRTIEVVREGEGDGETFYFRVNGKDVYAKGSNWIPCEAHPSKRTKERIRHLIESAKDSNMNMIRVWGGGVYEPDFFYEQCDEMGLLVWQDMMFACGVYPDWPEFLDNVRAEVEHQVKRLRSHPSIALWCGDNENISCVYVTRSHYALIDRLNRVEGEVIAKSDPTREYWPTSPGSGDRVYEDNFDERKGDTHLWGVSDGNRSIRGYLNAKCRFVSEFGFSSFPSMGLVKQFAEPQDYNVTSRVMENHVKKDSAPSGIFSMMSEYFLMPGSFEETLKLSATKQAFALQAISEKWRMDAPYCRGILIWQLNDWWPVTSWSTIEYDGRWKPAQYATKRFFSPLAAMIERSEGREKAKVAVVWDLPERIDVQVVVTLRRMADGAEISKWERNISIDGAKVETLDLPDFAHDRMVRGGYMETESFLCMETSGKDEKGRKWEHRDSVLLTKPKYCEMRKATLKVEKVEEIAEGIFDVDVSVDTPAFFVNMVVESDPKGRFDDNYVTIVPPMRRFRYKAGRKMTAEELLAQIEF